MYKLMVIIFLSWISLSWAANYYVSATATGSGNGTQGNPFTLLQAVSAVQPGDMVILAIGNYDISSGVDFNVNGTSSNPIVWVGTIGSDFNYDVITATGTNSTLLNHNSGSSISMSGNYNEFHKIIFQQNVEQQTLVNISGVGVYWDSCATKYPSNVGSSGHIVMITSRDVTLHHSTFNGGGRCIVWPVSYNNSSPNNFTMDGCILTRSNNHPALQFMPMPNQATAQYVDSTTIKNCLFIDNGYGANLYVRWARYWKIYNNVFIRSGKGFDGDHHQDILDPPGAALHDTCNTFGGLFAYNTIIGGTGDGLMTKGMQQIVNKNNLYYSSSDFRYILSYNKGYYSTYVTPINLRMTIDYNLYYEAGGVPYNWQFDAENGSGQTTTNYATFNGYNGNTFNANSIYGTAPTFTSMGSDDYTPLNESSSQVGAGIPIPGITTDKDGNPRDPNNPTIGAFEYVSSRPDITPPEVTGATLLDSITLKIMFSEALDETTAEDENNYSISNNIDISNASLSGSEVTLQTTAHSPGSYTVTVVNVEDLAGNPISQSNTAEYTLIPPDTLVMLPIENVEGVIQEPDHTPLKTIDGLGTFSGDPDSRWAAEPMPEELIFDLGSNRTICKAKLSFYRWNYGRVYSYSILISSDNNNWVTIVSQATSASNEEWTIDEFSAVVARYVKILFINNTQNDWAGLWEVELWGISSTDVDPVNNGLPNEFSLHQNYPNPFNPSTTISYFIPASSFVTLKVYDVLGNEIATLVSEEKPAGSYEVEFSTIGGSASGGDVYNLPSGIYFYRLQAGSFVETKKMVLMK